PGTAARPISLDPLCWLLRSALLDDVVPKGGLEPPRPCGHMTLNHARLPIPPLRHAPARTESNTPWWDGSQRRGVGVRGYNRPMRSTAEEGGGEPRVALVTGGASGIGRACAQRLIADGLEVVIAD